MVIRAYSYVRFSSKKQKNGDSLSRQMEISKSFAAERGLVLDETLCLHDLGVSAFTNDHLNKGAFGLFIRAVDEGIVPRGSYFLVESLDRFSRAQVPEALSLFLHLINKGVTIVTLVDRREFSKESIAENYAQLIISIAMMAHAHEESLNKSKRIAAAWENKHRDAVETGKVISRTCPFWLKAKDDKFGYEILRYWAVLVRCIYRASKQGVSSNKIASCLNERGIQTPQGKQWRQSNVAGLLRSREVLGEAGFADCGPNYYPQIISNKEFNEVRARIESGRWQKASEQSSTGAVGLLPTNAGLRKNRQSMKIEPCD